MSPVNPEQSQPEAERPKEQEAQKANPEKKEAMDAANEHLNAADQESTRRTDALNDANRGLAKTQEASDAEKTESPSGRRMRQATEHGEMIGGQFGVEFAKYSNATKEAVKRYQASPSQERKQVMLDSAAAEEKFINDNRNEWDKFATVDLAAQDKANSAVRDNADFHAGTSAQVMGLTIRDTVRDRLARINEVRQLKVESTQKRNEWKEKQRQSLDATDFAFKQSLEHALRQLQPGDAARTMVENALARVESTIQARQDAHMWEQRQDQVNAEEIYLPSIDVERSNIKLTYGMWKGTSVEGIMRDRYTQLTKEVEETQSDREYLEDLRKVTNEPVAKVRISDMSEFARQKYFREKASGRGPKISQEDFDKKHFNANVKWSGERPAGAPSAAPVQKREELAKEKVQQSAPSATPDLVPVPGRPGISIPASMVLGATPSTSVAASASSPSAAPAPSPSSAPAASPSVPSQLSPEQDALKQQVESDVQQLLGTPEWNDPAKKPFLQAELAEKHGVKVDDSGTVIDVPDPQTKDGAKMLARNKFEGKMVKEKAKAQTDLQNVSALPEDQKNLKVAEAMQKYGVSVDKDGNVSAPNNQFEKILNHGGGHLMSAMVQISRFLEPIRKMWDRVFGNKAASTLNTLSQTTDAAKNTIKTTGAANYQKALLNERDALQKINASKRTPEENKRLIYVDNEWKRLNNESTRTAAEDSFENAKPQTKADAQAVVDALSDEIKHLKSYSEGATLKRAFKEKDGSYKEDLLVTRLEAKKTQYEQKKATL